jgi:hypothetical protein
MEETPRRRIALTSSLKGPKHEIFVAEFYSMHALKIIKSERMLTTQLALKIFKGTVQREPRWVKIGINRSIMMSSLAGKCPLLCPKGHHHERNINVLSGCNTF